MIPFVALALQAAAAPAAPQPATLHTYQDWTVGCDNGRACHAVALAVFDGGGDGWLTLGLRRGAAGDAEPVVTLGAAESLCGATLSADGTRLAVRIIEAGTCTIVRPQDVPALIAALRGATRLQAADADGRPIGTVSLSGASAAMLYMDEAQQRLDTETALVRRGSHPAAAVPPPPALPVVAAAPIAQEGAIELPPERIAALRRETGCTIDEVGGPDEVSTVPLDAENTLVLLACGTGAYNLSSVVMIARRDRARIAIAPARFDDAGNRDAAGRVVLVNAEWDWEKGLLKEFPRGRGLGDCGERSRYVWDGTRFRLVFREEMGECRGSIDFITTWRARVTRPTAD